MPVAAMASALMCSSSNSLNLHFRYVEVGRNDLVAQCDRRLQGLFRSQHGIDDLVRRDGAGVANDLEDMLFVDEIVIHAIEKELWDLVAGRNSIAADGIEQEFACSRRDPQTGPAKNRFL